MSDVTARLDLPLIKPSQAQKHVTHNEALQVLDGLVQAALEEVGAETPPFEPVNGTLFALGASPSGAWANQGGKLALRSGEGWVFMDPEQGWHAWDKAAGVFKIFNGGAWQGLTAEFQNLPGVGVGTTSDNTNRLAVSSDASLFNHDGAGHQVKVNKASNGDTASLLFQSGFTGHAEMGLAGDTAFSIKVSNNGSTWFDAIRASGATQQVEIDLPLTGDAVQNSATDDTLGRLLKTRASATVMSGGLESLVQVSGSANAINVTTGANLSGLTPGYMIRFRANSSNSGATTLNLDGTGALPCSTVTGATTPPDYIRTDADTTATYDGSGWVLDRAPERGSNANGDYVRMADGTQMTQDTVTLLRVNSVRLDADIVFPAEFSSTSNLTVIAQTQYGTFSSSSTNLQQLSQTRAFSFMSTGCTLESRMIDGLSGLSNGDRVFTRTLAFGFWY